MIYEVTALRAVIFVFQCFFEGLWQPFEVSSVSIYITVN